MKEPLWEAILTKWQCRVVMKCVNKGSSVGVDVIWRGCELYMMVKGHEGRRHGWRCDSSQAQNGVGEMSLPMGVSLTL